MALDKEFLANVLPTLNRAQIRRLIEGQIAILEEWEDAVAKLRKKKPTEVASLLRKGSAFRTAIERDIAVHRVLLVAAGKNPKLAEVFRQAIFGELTR